MEVEGEGTQSVEQLAIVERYETVIAYLYPIAQNIGRRHGVAKAYDTSEQLVADADVDAVYVATPPSSVGWV